MKTLLETFYTKNSDFCTKNDVSFLKNPIKPQKTRLEVGFLGGFFCVLLGGLFIANPGLYYLSKQSGLKTKSS
jgi:hypothetical protein